MNQSFYRPFIHKTYKRFKEIPNSKKNASYFTLTLSLLSLTFFGLFAIRPTLITAISLIKGVQDLKKINNDYQNKIANVIRSQTEYDKIRTTLPLMDLALPNNASFPKVALALEKFAQRENFTINQLQIDNTSVSTLSASPKVVSFGFNLVGTGTYSQISSFLSHLINWKRIINIESLDFIKEAGTSGNLKLSIKGTTYYEP